MEREFKFEITVRGELTEAECLEMLRTSGFDVNAAVNHASHVLRGRVVEVTTHYVG